MSEADLVLAQISPAAATLTTLYTVSSTSAVVSSITICNSNVLQINFSISVAIGGASDSVKQYIYSLLPLLGNDTFIATIGLTLANGDVIRCYSDTSNVSFNLFGIQIT